MGLPSHPAWEVSCRRAFIKYEIHFRPQSTSTCLPRVRPQLACRQEGNRNDISRSIHIPADESRLVADFPSVEFSLHHTVLRSGCVVSVSVVVFGSHPLCSSCLSCSTAIYYLTPAQGRSTCSARCLSLTSEARSNCLVSVYTSYTPTSPSTLSGT